MHCRIPPAAAHLCGARRLAAPRPGHPHEARRPGGDARPAMAAQRRFRVRQRHVAVSRPTAETLVSQGQISAEKLHVVPSGLDLSRFAPDPVARARVRAELGISQQAWVLGSVGRLSAVKNHALRLRAAAQALPEDGRLLRRGRPRRAPRRLP
ncbi:hypothetical protein WMF39_03100 [Sorangium sp. So ce1504]|uniref:hypothetical protein n=1 Tax=Sorangium sp. So ce1504 TaxID=3133337 RepID=UPI003F61678E